MDGDMDWLLAQLLVFNGCGEQHKIQLKATHHWRTSTYNTGTSSLELLHLSNVPAYTPNPFASEWLIHKMDCVAVQGDLAS